MSKKKEKRYRCRELIAESLVAQGVEFCFGIVGYPVQELGQEIQEAGIKYIGMHNEQAASYAAAAVGYLTGRPGACLTVTGPGMIHAVAGMANAQSNCWPMICLSGASERSQDGIGSFQEAKQLLYAHEACKWYNRVPSYQYVPRLIEQAVRYSMAGRPGACYIDLPADVMREAIPSGRGSIEQPPMAPGQGLTEANSSEVKRAMALLSAAKAPLVIIGKGAAFGRAEDELKHFVEHTNIPYITVPMGKGVIPDDHPNHVVPARSTALKEADIVLLVGARLNWILHFGGPPRYDPNVRFIKIDVYEEEMHNSKPAEVALVGNAKCVIAQMNEVHASNPWKYDNNSTYWNNLRSTIAKNKKISADLGSDKSSPLNYYATLQCIQSHLPRDAFIMSEGANTMDIGRTILDNYLPRSRLDAGTFGTMGVGLGQLIAAAVVHPDRKVVGVMGDSAFGFSAMEYETVVRFQMNVLIIILNNNGIGGGPRNWKKEWDTPMGAVDSPVNSLNPAIRYEKLTEAFGGRAFYATTYDEVNKLTPEAIAHKGPAIFHIRINVRANRKKQEFPFGSMQSMLAGSAPVAKNKTNGNSKL